MSTIRISGNQIIYNMRCFSLLAGLLLLMCSCNQNQDFQDIDDKKETDVFTASFESSRTRTYIDEENKLHWTADDCISVFNGTTGNQKYKFKGNTGDVDGDFEFVDGSESGLTLSKNYALYPYDASAEMINTGTINAYLPSEQSYTANSFGLGANTMVAVTRSTSDKSLSFKNIGGFLKIPLCTEGATLNVKSVKLRGNNNEKIAGKASIKSNYGEAPVVTMSEDALTEITLNCGDGIVLSTDYSNPTVFWFVLPPTTFTAGFTIEVVLDDGGILTKSTSNEIAIERNCIHPMEATYFFGFNITCSNGGTLASRIYDNTHRISAIEWLNISGNLNGKDINFLRKNFRSLSHLNLKNANIVASTDVYYTEGNTDYSTVKDQFPIHFMTGSDLTNLKSIILPSSINSIGAYAFLDVWDDNTLAPQSIYPLKHVEIGENVTTIGILSFGCSIETIHIPNPNGNVYDVAFGYCPNLKSITVTAKDTYKDKLKSFDGVLYGSCSSTSGDLISFPCAKTSYTAPEGFTVDRIETRSLNHCIHLTEFTIPEGTKELGSNIFQECKNLTKLTIPASVTYVGTEALEYSYFTEIHIKHTTPPSWYFKTGTHEGYISKSSCILYVPKDGNWTYSNSNYSKWSNNFTIVQE